MVLTTALLLITERDNNKTILWVQKILIPMIPGQDDILHTRRHAVPSAQYRHLKYSNIRYPFSKTILNQNDHSNR
ncbi:MAG: hypothetical protein JXR41_14145, partial [Bacteroidales bacterium]|nr:hypothetical protein [Bacteroidales bacterium]